MTIQTVPYIINQVNYERKSFQSPLQSSSLGLIIRFPSVRPRFLPTNETAAVIVLLLLRPSLPTSVTQPNNISYTVFTELMKTMTLI